MRRQRAGEIVRGERFRQKFVDPRLQTSAAVVGEGIGGEGDDAHGRAAQRPLLRANHARGARPVEGRHSHVHQNGVEGGLLAPARARRRLDRRPSVAHMDDLRAQMREMFARDKRVDLVVLGEKHAQAQKGRSARRLDGRGLADVQTKRIQRRRKGRRLVGMGEPRGGGGAGARAQALGAHGLHEPAVEPGERLRPGLAPLEGREQREHAPRPRRAALAPSPSSRARR